MVQTIAQGDTASTSIAPMLAKTWQANLDPSAYLVSEKLDGVRALWDGQVLRFKSGRVIAAPNWFTAALPTTPLDGELWMGRHSFDRLSGIVRHTTPHDADWRDVRFMIFDIPGGDAPFVQRATRITSALAAKPVAWLQAVEQFRVLDRAGLQAQLQKTVALGGEGLVLHQADAVWHAGRSDALRKLKSVPDEDATVIAQIPGKGRHKGRMGALLLELPNGQRFALGTGFTDAQRESPPPVGSTVTYHYHDRTPAGLPKFASYWRSRDSE
jgi:DNA ligase-1